MPDSNRQRPRFCSYCGPIPDYESPAAHVASGLHKSTVHRYNCSAAYRNRQGDLPFPLTLHDPPKLR